jgi:hypothetical protein
MAFALASAADLLARTNDLLHKVGINALPIPSLVELQQSASSMFVAVFEAIIQVSTACRQCVKRHFALKGSMWCAGSPERGHQGTIAQRGLDQ